MKKLLFLFALFVLLSCICYSQNLVPNPSFEDTVVCPTGQAQIQNAIGWINFGGTPDYYNVCATSFQSSVPNNWVGNQYPASGNAYVGLFTKQPPTINAREYIGIKLSDTLIIGASYFVSFRLSLGYGGTGGINCATNNLGALFSVNQFYYTGMYPAITKNYAHIFETEIITDTTNWTTISGNFVADSAYQYLVIGNFFDDILTSHIKYFDNGYSECASYYYIDDVYVGIDTTVNANYYNMQNSIKIFPNPSSGVISVLLPVNNIPATLKTYNLFGKIVYEITLFDEETTIYYNEIPTGIYFIKVQTDNYNIVKKLLINKKY